MLVLSRKKGQSIFVADSLILTLSEIRSGQARIHFFTHSDNPIRREELVSLDEQDEIRERILEANALRSKYT